MRNLPAKVRQELDAKAEEEARSNKPKPTNADRIRAMSDEELAEVLAVFQCEGWNMCCKTFAVKGHIIDGRGNNPDILDWLQQPAPEEGEQ